MRARWIHLHLTATAVAASVLCTLPVHAASIQVDAGCSIAQALQAAETDAAVAGCSAGSGADEILIPGGTEEVWTTPAPALTTSITLRAVGGRATIRRATTGPAFRLLDLAGTAQVTLEDLSFRDGISAGNSDGAGCIQTRSTTTLTARRVVFDGCALPAGLVTEAAAALLSEGVTLLENCLVMSSQTNGQAAVRVRNSGALSLVNTTVTSSDGIGLLVTDGTLELTHVTLAANSGADLFVRGGRVANARNSVIQNLGGDLTIDQSNLINTPALLGPLADNGGPTLTFAPLQGSGVLDAADDTFCLATDQRGTARPSGAHCDIGALEHVVVCNNGFLHPSEACDGAQLQPQFALCPPGTEGTPTCDASCDITGCTQTADAGVDASTGGQAGAAGGQAGAAGSAAAGSGGVGGALQDAGSAGTPVYQGDGSVVDAGTRSKKPDDGDCGCRLQRRSEQQPAWLFSLLALVWFRRRRRVLS